MCVFYVKVDRTAQSSLQIRFAWPPVSMNRWWYHATNVLCQFIGIYYPSPIDLGQITRNRWITFHNVFLTKLRSISKKKLVSLEEKIASIDTVLLQIARRRASLMRRINGLLPIARIPSEILIKIFQIACQPIAYGYRKAVTPLFIGSICGLWRDVAWSTPLLWNTILLNYSRKHHDSLVQLLGDWLLKARSEPLSIKVTVVDECDYDYCGFEAIMRILVTRSDYWRRLLVAVF